MEYQPRWVGGREVGTGQRKAASRYEAIAARLAGQRGFSVLDVGAYNGYFALRLAEDFDARGVAADPWPGLRRALDEAGDDRIVGLQERLTPDRVRELGNVDVVLCLSVLHHVPYWRELLAAMREQGKVLFVETAVPAEVLPKAAMHHESDQIAAAVEALGGEVIARTHGYKSRRLRPLRMIGDLA